MTSRIVDPRLMSTLARDFFPQSGKLQEPLVMQETTGQPINDWADVTGWTDIACRVSPAGGQERRYAKEKFVDATDVALLAGYFDGLDESYRFVVGERAYEIVRVESDSENATTRLTLRTVR